MANYTDLTQFTQIVSLMDSLKPQSNEHTEIQWLVHWPLMGGLFHLVQWEGAWAGCGPTQSPPRCTKYNTTHLSTASVPIFMWHYNLGALKVW